MENGTFFVHVTVCVYEGPGLAPRATYTFKVEEWQAADRAGRNVTARWSAGSGSFTTAAAMPTPKEELAAVLSNRNNSLLWSTSRDSVWQRVEPSGFLPTSVSGGYGGITSECEKSHSPPDRSISDSSLPCCAHQAC